MPNCVGNAIWKGCHDNGLGRCAVEANHALRLEYRFGHYPYSKEYAVTDVIIGLHRKVNIVDSFFGMLTENLLKGLHREVMVSKFLMPINTIRRVIVAVPPKAEYEAGFLKWVEHFCRLGSTLGCRVHFMPMKRLPPIFKGW